VEFTSDLEGQGEGGENCFLVFDSSPDVVELLIPMDIRRHTQEYKFPNYKIPLEERTGGIIIRYPMAIVRGDGA
ncbi:major capsid protein, partial [Salmonella enterica subsp. enterica serovar Typhimurium]|uniref:major capsid family protein n=1 Tax=Salmonella enterica TaxID=28901 RepID=UPI000CAA1B0F